MECWCKRWRLSVNLSKTNILHVRDKKVQQSNFIFLFDKIPVPYCTRYKYLGLFINEHLDYKQIAELQSEAASRALSLIITKMIKNGGFPYNVYSTLYESCCASVSDYGGEVIGAQQFNSTLKLHLRAARAFLGCPANTTSPSVLSKIMWVLPFHRNQVRMVRQYNGVLKMAPIRLTRVVC